MSAIELTEKLLAEAGGWQAMKQARAMAAAGLVAKASYAPPLLTGLARDAGKEFRAGLKIITATKVENLCTCRPSREWGSICAHSLAVGLAVLRPRVEIPASAESPRAETPGSGQPRPFFTTEEGSEKVRLHVVLPMNFDAALEKETMMIGIEAERGAGRVLVHALPAARRFTVAPEDLALVEKICALTGGELAGMLALSRGQTAELLEALRSHVRVTFGKRKPADVALLLQQLAPTARPIELVKAEAEQGTPKFSLALEGSLNHLAASLRVGYGDREFLVTGERKGARNFNEEAAALDRLRRAGFVGPDGKGELVLKREPSILRFFASELPALQRDWKVSIGARFENVTAGIERITPQLDFQSSGEDWFELRVGLETEGGQRFSAAEIQGLLRGGQSHVRLKNNRLAVFSTDLLDELEHVLRDCSPHQNQPGSYRINRIHAGYIDAALGDRAKVTGTPAWRSWSRTQRQLETQQPVPLGALEEVLRPYQKQGVYWMHFLAKHGLGGILADEMGLGKTIQALALLKALGGPALIVCPSSLVYNWQREAERFTPGRKLLVLAGGGRDELYAALGECDLAITSYPILRRDALRYRGCNFRAVILDEAQHIKNPDTQNAQAATELNAEARFVLTGTPVENSVRDLWSLTNFVMPGYLGSRTDFRERYEKPISEAGDAPEKQRLANRIRPFLLRRLKKSVLTELPDKIEQVAYCELTTHQRTLYTSLLEQGRAQFTEASRGSGGGAARMMALTVLLRLRQVCCDLRLLNLPQPVSADSSSKIQLLEELLGEGIDGGHRILVFSQFVSMLHLIREHLEGAKIPYCYLDGSTRNRLEEVDRFQTAENIPIFLISLKAGGVGLNLTAADTVIHYDPWWNPAVEAQATDRVHRIGQKRVVTSYKLIARDTVEEKILQLQRKKRGIIDATVESEQPLMSGITLADIGELLG